MEDTNNYPVAGSKNEGYSIEFRPDGVYAVIYPADPSVGTADLSDICKQLKDHNVLDYDIEVLTEAMKQMTGKPVLISEEAVSEGNDGEEEQKPTEYAKITITISSDRMQALVHRDIKMDVQWPTADMIRQALADKGVVFGIEDHAIEIGAGQSEDFVAAKGIPPVNGEDARIERHFNMDEKGRPSRNKYNQVNYKDLNIFILAKKGDVLAERIPQTKGTPGRDVFGNEVMPKNGRPIPLPVGKNTEVQDENFIVAKIDGQIVESNKRINIDPHLEISGDVGVPTGNIDFVGSVDVSGNVEAGFILKATGDIQIQGMISGGDVEGKNVHVSGGIQGMGRGTVKASENVEAAYAENADIEAEGNIYIHDAALHSNIRAGKKIVVSGKRGLVNGGYLAAGEEIQAATIGNPMNVVTRLVVGVNPMLQKKYQDACKEYKESKQRLDQLMKTLNTLEKIKINISTLPPERAEQIRKLKLSQFPLAGKVERSEKLVRELDEERMKMQKGRIMVEDTVYPGTKLSINTLMKSLQTEEKHCSFMVDDDGIRTGPY